IERQPRRVALTEMGTKILPLARRMLQESDEIVALARNEHDPLSGKLKVALIPTIGPYLLPLLMRKLRRKLPRLKLMLYEYQTQDRKSTRLNSSHVKISYAVFCLKKKPYL